MNREEAQFVLFRSVFGSILEENFGKEAIRKVFNNIPLTEREEMSKIQRINDDPKPAAKPDEKNKSKSSGICDILEEDSYSSSSFSDDEIFSIQ